MISSQLYGACSLPRHLFSLKKLTDKMPIIRELTLSSTESLSNSLPHIREHLHQCGINLVTFINDPALQSKGYIKKNTDRTLLLCIKERHDDPQIQHYELFHLLGHIINGDLDRTNLLIDLDRIKDAADRKAEQFAAHQLF